MTCVGNDFSFNEIFSRYVEAMGCKGDVLLAISTSGHSENILKAAVQAHNNGMKVIAQTAMSASRDSSFSPFEVSAITFIPLLSIVCTLWGMSACSDDYNKYDDCPACNYYPVAVGNSTGTPVHAIGVEMDPHFFSL